MNKFMFSALLYEVYNEILFVTFNYQKERIGEKEIRKLSNSDFKNLEKSKYLSEYFNDFISFPPDQKYIFDDKFLKILELRDYNVENLTYMVKYMDEYIDYYQTQMEKIEKSLIDVIDIKEKSNGFKGGYPTYIKLSESEVKIERIIISLNTKNYLNKTDKKFGYFVTFMDYHVKLENYCYNGKDLRDKDKDEVFKILDSSLKVNLADSKYYSTKTKEIDLAKEEIVLMDEGEASIFLDKKQETFGGLKNAMKASFKQTFITLGIIIVVLIVVFIIKYLK